MRFGYKMHIGQILLIQHIYWTKRNINECKTLKLYFILNNLHEIMWTIIV
jgi:hypothetical protein